MKQGKGPETVTLAPGESYLTKGKSKHDKLLIHFTKVITDSRCPKGMVCKWSGFAEIELELVTSRLDTSMVYLFTGHPDKAMYPSEISTGEGGYVIKLNRLEPRPEPNKDRVLADYMAEVVVSW